MLYIIFNMSDQAESNSLSLSDEEIKKLFAEEGMTEEEFNNQKVPGTEHSDAFMRGMGLQVKEEGKDEAENEETNAEEGKSEEETTQGIMSQEEIDALFGSSDRDSENS